MGFGADSPGDPVELVDQSFVFIKEGVERERGLPGDAFVAAVRRQAHGKITLTRRAKRVPEGPHAFFEVFDVRVRLPGMPPTDATALGLVFVLAAAGFEITGFHCRSRSVQIASLATLGSEDRERKLFAYSNAGALARVGEGRTFR